MKKSWIRLCAVIGFCLLFIITFLYVSNVLRKKVGSVDAIHSFYKEKENTIDAVFVGSSHVYRAIAPMDLWHTQGISSYVLASPSQKLPVSYHVIKDAIRRQRPKVVVLEMYGLVYAKGLREHGNANIHQAIDPLPIRASKIEFLTDTIPRFVKEDKQKKVSVEFLFPIVKYHERWKVLEKEDFKNENAFYKGQVISFGIKPEEKPAVITSQRPVPEEAMTYLEKTIELCKKENVALILMETPLAKKDKHYKYTREIYNTVNQYAKEHGIPYIDFQSMDDEINLDYATDMCDAQHLNYNGAQKITKYLGNYLKEKYNLTDHREDPDYSSWQEDYKSFENAVKNEKDEESNEE